MNKDQIKILKLGSGKISYLPNNFSFDGTLDLTGSSLTELPEGLTLKGDLIIGNSNVTTIPENALIYGDIIDNENKITCIPKSSLIYGSIISQNTVKDHISSKGQYIVLDNGKVFYYKKIFRYDRRSDTPGVEPDRVSINFYFGYGNHPCAAEFTIFNKTFKKECKNLREGRFFADYQLALEKGMMKYKDLNLDEPRTAKELVEIYTLIANPCSNGLANFFKEMNFTMDTVISIRELNVAISKYAKNHVTPAFEVWLHFFGLPHELE